VSGSIAQAPVRLASNLPHPFDFVVLGAALLLALAVLLRLYLSRRALQQRATELAELANIGKAFAVAPLDLEELAEVAYQETARLLEMDFFQMGVFEASNYQTLIWVRDGERLDNQDFALLPEQDGLVGWVRQNGRPLLVSDFESGRDHLPTRPSSESPDPSASGIFVPLQVGDQVIGIVAIQSRKRKAFSEHHLRLLTIVANAVASALAITNLKSQLEFRSLQLLLIEDISRRLVSLQPLPELFGQVASLVSQGLEYYSVRVFETTPEGLLLRASSRSDVDVKTLSVATPEALVNKAAEQGKTQTRTAAPEKVDGPAAPDPARGLAELAIPLKVEDRVLGVLDILSDSHDSFSPEHVALAETVAAHLALATLEARNFAQQQEEAWTTTVLLEVARHAAQPGDVEEALQAVLQLTTLLAGATWAVLLLPEGPEESLRLGPVSGLRRQMQDALADQRIPPSSLGIQPPFESEAPSRVRLPVALADPLDAREATAVTLSDGTSLLGILLLEGQELAGRRLSLLVSIAHQISLRLENTRLIEAAAARRSLERELAMAREIQESFLPSHLPSHSGWEIAATWRVAREVSGDFYDFIPLTPGPDGPRWGIVIADVADKGMPAALFMALCRTLLRSIAISRVEPGPVLERLNELIFADSKAGMFVSVFYAVWEPLAARLSFANGGHNPPLLFLPERPPARLSEHGMVLGVNQGLSYQTHIMTMAPGSMLVLYTDGVTEAMDSDGRFFGVHRLENLVQGIPEWHAQAVAEAIADRVSNFCCLQYLEDDLTAVVLHRKGLAHDGESA
jgi:serine phosphatase RsbU (regulator of sigma subunit)/GAF domain-containing protein